jgi:DNA-binding NarL/FixJ family response regulator
MYKILIADDHSMVRKGLKQLCESMGDVLVAGEAANGDEVLEALRQTQVDLLLLDLTMPGIRGVELVECIRTLYPSLPILIFSMRNEAALAKRMAKMGVSGYITKGCSDEMLMSAIRKVAAGGSYVDPVIAERMMFEKTERSQPESEGHLSERELEIFKLLAQGKSVNEIAAELFLSSRTVSTYKTRLMHKMNFHNNAELVLYASESGLIG